MGFPLFGSESLDGLDSGGTPRGDKPSKRGCDKEQNRCDGEDSGIVGRKTKQKTGRHVHSRKGESDAND
jgi:hypothetical protein